MEKETRKKGRAGKIIRGLLITLAILIALGVAYTMHMHYDIEPH